MELLELEMRARAIKSLLNVEKEQEDPELEADTDKPQETKDEEAEKAAETKDIEDKEADNEQRRKEAEDKEIMRKAAEEEKRLQKARLALMSSEARKREEEEALERKHAEIRLLFFSLPKNLTLEYHSFKIGSLKQKITAS